MYEALRAYFVEDQPSADAAKAFGYTPGSFRVLCHQFRRDPAPAFFVKASHGPSSQPKKSVARDIEKTLRSAIANAVNVADKNQKRRLDEDDLFVSACYADQGPSQKRVRPAPMGRAFRVIKRSAHLTVHVSERESK